MNRGAPPAARRFLVQGRVQGVGFRWSTMAEAERLGLAGWARNLPDGRVEVHAQGNPAALAALAAWLRAGPIGAEVVAVGEEPAQVGAGLEGFEIRP
ncbi:MAG: acylphosphatase [Acidimicrobiia bacterium]|nr:acylphosphatase [Acidimicrobiia bacterium]